MQPPEACSSSLPSSFLPHSSPPALCECRRCISQRGLLLISHSPDKKGVSLALSLPIHPSQYSSLSPPLPLLPCFKGERESCWLPEADCSSLNNSSWLPAVLSPVLHHSITPLHKDVQMGWDAHSHMTLPDTLKQACAHIHANLHTFAMHMVRKAHICLHTHVNRCTQTHMSRSTRKGCSVAFLQTHKWRGRKTFSPFSLFTGGKIFCILFSFPLFPPSYSSSLLSFSSHCAPTGG